MTESLDDKTTLRVLQEWLRSGGTLRIAQEGEEPPAGSISAWTKDGFTVIWDDTSLNSLAGCIADAGSEYMSQQDSCPDCKKVMAAAMPRMALDD